MFFIFFFRNLREKTIDKEYRSNEFCVHMYSIEITTTFNTNSNGSTFYGAPGNGNPLYHLPPCRICKLYYQCLLLCSFIFK